jgi:N-acetylglucosamine-6-phosphate deacetylase
MLIEFRGADLFGQEKSTRQSALLVEDNKIAGIYPSSKQPGQIDEIVSCQGLTVIPGLIDVHTHGAMGYDSMDATPEALHEMGRFFARHGVTSFLATTVSNPPEKIMAAIQNVVSYPQYDDAAQVLGVHVEGPYINPEARGAQLLKDIRLPDSKEYDAWFDSGVIKLVTVAPELPGADELITAGVKRGIEFAAGHSTGTYEQIVRAADLGLRQTTHTFNGMKPLHHREPGLVGAALSDDRIFAQMIVDGVHLHPAVIKIIFRAKSSARTLLITDGMRGTGLPDGVYGLGGEDIQVKDGVARNSTGHLAGSTLTLDRAVANLVRFTGADFFDAVRAATQTPAEALHLEDRKGVLKEGADADIVVVDEQMNVRLTMVNGKIVYRMGI